MNYKLNSQQVHRKPQTNPRQLVMLANTCTIMPPELIEHQSTTKISQLCSFFKNIEQESTLILCMLHGV